MKVTLNKVDEKTLKVTEKTYEAPFVPSGVMLDYYELEEKLDLNNPKRKEYNELIKLLVKTFFNQFTSEEFIEGTPHYKFNKTLVEFIRFITTNPYPSGNESGEQQGTAK